MDWKLELVVVPVADQDLAKAFYLDAMDFDLIVDHRAGEHFRVIQASPPGSASSPRGLMALLLSDPPGPHRRRASLSIMATSRSAAPETSRE